MEKYVSAFGYHVRPCQRPLPPAERPLRRDAERNRQRILEAARVVFAERGLSGSHDDIAREAGVGVGTVYRRFPDKEQLIDALFEERIEEIADVARAAADHPDPVGEPSPASSCACRSCRARIAG